MTTKVIFSNTEIFLDGTRKRPDSLILGRSAVIFDFGDGAAFVYLQQISDLFIPTVIFIDSKVPKLDFVLLRPKINLDTQPFRAEFTGHGKEKE